MVDFEVVDLPETDHVAVGEQAPDFERPLVNDEFWEDVALSDLTAEGPVLLVFHPMDGAFPATYVWSEIRDREWTSAFDAQIVGCSISSPYEHKDLIADSGIDASLFSDPAADVAETYGVENDLDGMAGITEHRPAVYLLDEERVVQYAWVAEQWPDFPPYDEVEDALGGL
ncbi:peroxiredoxin-like protein [Salinarchaeum sp. Harcht-Bsk1]|uniref:redoxin domain-containing protein n=1 Tax=Salinarchaeum sp. Harcht-Bsk1 TaxID=1333523 RepID=UPI0003422AFF|nr:redoxin domain-containing protein [Salinarchaeum sp. Harcht-Bsk1]AGN01496.1 peroxiredoxin-like protein [Salinarchaeum sp. Harcht-Bsk1]